MGSIAVALQKKIQQSGGVLGTFFRVVLTITLIFSLIPVAYAAVDNTSSLLDDSTLDISTFDHLATGFPLEGNHITTDCESCHVGGVFEGLPKKCETCHDGSFAVGMDSGHIPTIENCDVS